MTLPQVTIYGRMSCGYCVRAKDLCEMKGLDYRFIDMIREGISKAELANSLGRPVETVPQVLVGSEHIGGYTEFAQYLRQKEEAAV